MVPNGAGRVLRKNLEGAFGNQQGPLPRALDEGKAQRGAVFCQMSHSWSGTEWDSNQVHGDLLVGTPVPCGVRSVVSQGGPGCSELRGLQ